MADNVVNFNPPPVPEGEAPIYMVNESISSEMEVI